MKLAGFTVGHGPRAVVLLHGFLGSARNLRTFAVRWSERDASRTFHLLDLTGHGDSPPVHEPLALATLAADVLDTVRAPELVGHSLGGRVALAALRLDPAIERVTLLDITPSPIAQVDSDSAAVLALIRRAPALARRPLRDWLVAEGLRPALSDWVVMNVQPDGAWRVDREALARLHAAVNAEDLWDVVDARTRCVRGARSRYVTDDDAARMRTETIDAGHFVHVDALDALLAVMTKT